jgi:hypothetical protein
MFENSQEYSQKLQQNCTFMNSVSVLYTTIQSVRIEELAIPPSAVCYGARSKQYHIPQAEVHTEVRRRKLYNNPEYVMELGYHSEYVTE